jgi:hypothetical protein
MESTPLLSLYVPKIGLSMKKYEVAQFFPNRLRLGMILKGDKAMSNKKTKNKTVKEINEFELKEVVITDLPAEEQKKFIEAITEKVTETVNHSVYLADNIELDDPEEIPVTEVVEVIEPASNPLDEYKLYYENHKDEIARKVRKGEYVQQQHEDYFQIVDVNTYELVAIRGN